MSTSSETYVLIDTATPIDGGSMWVDISPDFFSEVVLIPVALVAFALTILGVIAIKWFRNNRPVLCVSAFSIFGAVLFNAQRLEKLLAVKYIRLLDDRISSVGFFGWPTDWCSGIFSTSLLVVYYYVSKNRVPRCRANIPVGAGLPPPGHSGQLP